MQENDFESTIRKKMQDLQLVPGAQVWDRVSAEINKEKRRKRFVVLVFAFLFIAAGGLLYFLILNPGGRDINVAANNKPAGNISTVRDSNRIKVETSNGASTSASKETTIITRGNHRVKRDDEGVGQDETEATHFYSRSTSSLHQTLGTDSSLVNINEPDTKLKAAEVPSPGGRHEENQLRELQSKVQDRQAGSEKISDTSASIKASLTQSVSKENTKDTVGSPAMNTRVVSQTKQKSRKWKYGFTVFAGVSNNLGRLPLFPSGSAYSYSNSPVSSGGNNSSIARLTYKANFSYGFGIYRQKRLSSKVSFSAGAIYHYATATSVVGVKHDSTQTFYDASLQNNATVRGYYATGDYATYANRYHLFEVPLNVLVQLNKNESRPTLLTAGISPAYLISNNALYANYNQNVYYENRSQLRRLLLIMQAGLQVDIIHGKLFSIAAGPEFTYGINNMAKRAAATNQHLFTAALKANITLR